VIAALAIPSVVLTYLSRITTTGSPASDYPVDGRHLIDLSRSGSSSHDSVDPITSGEAVDFQIKADRRYANNDSKQREWRLHGLETVPVNSQLPDL
jgi:hypothetical protein